MPSVVPAWEDVAAANKQRLDAAIEATSFATPDVSAKQLNVKDAGKELLTAEEIAITESSVGELLIKLRIAEWSSEAVTVRPLSSDHLCSIRCSLVHAFQRAFVHRAVIAHKLVRFSSSSLFACSSWLAAASVSHATLIPLAVR